MSIKTTEKVTNSITLERAIQNIVNREIRSLRQFDLRPILKSAKKSGAGAIRLEIGGWFTHSNAEERNFVCAVEVVDCAPSATIDSDTDYTSIGVDACVKTALENLKSDAWTNADERRQANKRGY